MDLALLILIPIFAVFLTEVLSLGFLASTILFFGAPALYLSFRKPAIVKKSLIFALLLGLGASFAIDHMNFLDNVWYEQHSMYRILGTIPVEDIVYAILWIYFGIVFYEYFLDHDRNKAKISPNIRYLVILLGLVTIGFFSLYFLQSPWLVQPYFYLKGGIVMLGLPVVAGVAKMPRIFRKLLIVSVYFAFVTILTEYVGLKHEQWLFLGNHYIGSSTFMGQVLPFEEIIFFWILGVPGIVCWYEFFADDRK